MCIHSNIFSLMNNFFQPFKKFIFPHLTDFYFVNSLPFDTKFKKQRLWHWYQLRDLNWNSQTFKGRKNNLDIFIFSALYICFLAYDLLVINKRVIIYINNRGKLERHSVNQPIEKQWKINPGILLVRKCTDISDTGRLFFIFIWKSRNLY